MWHNSLDKLNKHLIIQKNLSYGILCVKEFAFWKFYKPNPDFHASDAFICEALRGAALVFQLQASDNAANGASDSAQGMKIFQLKKKKFGVQSVTWKLLSLFDITW